uniref:Platelet-derived growth factor (PDGF) family profile domain-containing protein n=1 Tax=Dendroctonus ponderosae TaxID=77166 RepID=A0AAR5P847_DENPD
MNALPLAIVILNAMMMAKCSNSWCHQKCLAIKQPNYPDNINIYFEYRRAVLKVPAVRNPPSSRVYRLSNGKIIPEVTLREYRVEPQEAMCKSAEVRSTKNAVKCKPRPFILDLVSDEGQLIPDKAATQLCMGFCNKRLKVPKICKSVKYENVSVPVQVLRKNRHSYCSTVLVPKDIKCSCQCAIGADSCTSKQTFSKKTCSCNCRKEEKTQCERKIDEERRMRGTSIHYWDSKSCSCECSPKTNCTTGLVWNESMCRCLSGKKESNG